MICHPGLGPRDTNRIPKGSIYPAGRPCSRDKQLAATSRFRELPRRSSLLRLAASELLVEVMQGEQERGGPTMRTMVRVVGPAALADQGGHFLGRESVAGPHRRITGPQAQEIVQHLLLGRELFLRDKIIDDSTEDGLRGAL